jgi:hypothetical protein
MEMIGHQAVAQQPHRNPPGGFGRRVKKYGKILRLVNDLGPRITSI